MLLLFLLTSLSEQELSRFAGETTDTTMVYEGVLLGLKTTHLLHIFHQIPNPCHISVQAAAVHYNAPTLNLTSTIATPLTLSSGATTTLTTTASRCPVLAYIHSRLLAFLSSPLSCHLVGTCSCSGGILRRPPANNTLTRTM
jgi:hypothetical protein